jgi:hypothetical protein
MVDADAVIAQARDAWERFKHRPSFADTLIVGRGLGLGRHLAMIEAATDRPRGRRYNSAFHAWLEANGLAGIDPSDRSRLFKIMAREPEVVAWRESLPVEEQDKLNNPSTVWRRFVKAVPEAGNGTPLVGFGHDAERNGERLARHLRGLGLSGEDAADLLQRSSAAAVALLAAKLMMLACCEIFNCPMHPDMREHDHHPHLLWASPFGDDNPHRLIEIPGLTGSDAAQQIVAAGDATAQPYPGNAGG